MNEALMTMNVGLLADNPTFISINTLLIINNITFFTNKIRKRYLRLAQGASNDAHTSNKEHIGTPYKPRKAHHRPPSIDLFLTLALLTFRQKHFNTYFLIIVTLCQV